MGKIMEKKSSIALLILFAIISLSACGGPKVSTASSSLPVVSGEQGKAPTLTPPTGTPPAELVSKDIFLGTGAAAVANSTLTVQYTLMAWSTGKVVESSWTGASPATFPLAQVIKGWQVEFLE